MVSIFFNENLEEEKSFEADFAEFTEDDKFLVLYRLKSKNIAGDEVGRFRANHIVGFFIDNYDE